MGYYINPPETLGDITKAEYLKQLGAVPATEAEAARAIKEGTAAAICLVDNGMFDAAGWAYDMREFQAFTYSGDKRPKRWFLMPIAVANEHAK